MTEEAIADTPTDGEVANTPAGMSFDPNSLSGELAQEPCLKNFDTVDKLANSYVHAVKKMGAPPENFLKIPSKEGESWDEIHRAIGRPDSAADYHFEDYASDDGGQVDQFKDWAMDLGLTNDQAHSILDELNGIMLKGSEQQKANKERQQMDAESALMKEWPGHQYEEEMDFAQRSFRQFADKEVQSIVDSSGVGNEPAFIKFFARIGRAMGESNMILGTPNQIGEMTPQAAKDRITELYNDPEFKDAYKDSSQKGFKDASKRMDRLFKIAYSSG